MPIITSLTTILLSVSEDLAGDFAKEKISNGIRRFLFPKKKYADRLYQIIAATVEEFEKIRPQKDIGEYFPFYKSKIIYSKLNKAILFHKDLDLLSSQLFQENPYVIPPTEDDLNSFYNIFISKFKSDKLLKKLYIEENYTNEIFTISQSLGELIEKTEEITQNLSAVSNFLLGDNPIRTGIEDIKNRFDKYIEIKKGYIIRGTSVPYKVNKYLERPATTDEFKKNFSSSTWLNLFGPVASGKTQFSISIAERFKHVYWISLNGIELNYIMEAILHEISGSTGQDINKTSISEILKLVGSDSIIILDGFPQFITNNTIEDQFINFLKELINQDVKLVTISNQRLPNRILQKFEDGIVIEKRLPFFTNEEVGRLMTLYGADDVSLEKWKKVVSELSEGNPFIINAICDFLKRRNWDYDQNTFGQLIRGQYAASIEEEIYNQIFSNTTDKETQDFLFRLKIIIGIIRIKDIHTVGDVSPAIEFVDRKLSSISGLWMEKRNDDEYNLSPLVKTISGNNLTSALYSAINIALGDAIWEKKVLDPISANKAINYYTRGGSFDKAGFIFMMVLDGCYKDNKIFYDFGFSYLWRREKLPDRMDLHLKSAIRALQILLLLKTEKKFDDFLILDLEHITNIAIEKRINVNLGAHLLVLYYHGRNFEKSNRYLLLALNSAKELGEDDPIFTSYEAPTLIWANLSYVKSISEFSIWLNAYQEIKVPNEEIDEEVANVSCLTFCGRLFENEQKKEHPEWQILIGVYGTIIERCTPYEGLTFLSACCYKFLIRISAAKMENMEQAVTIFFENISKFDKHLKSTFYLNEELGRQLYEKKKLEDAIKYLTSASLIDLPEIYTEKIEVNLILNEIYGNDKRQLADQFVAAAYDQSKNNQFVSDVFFAVIVGEYSIAEWERGERNSIFYLMETGVDKLLSSYTPQDEYKGTIIRYGHVLNYYYHVVTERQLPKLDGEPYAVPFRGSFGRSNEKLLESGFYFEERRFFLAFLTLTVFEELNDVSMARKWATISFKMVDEQLVNPFAAMLSKYLFYLVLDNKFETAVLYEIKISKLVEKMTSNPDGIKNLNPILDRIIEKRPKIDFSVPGTVDHFIFEHVIIFITIKVLWDYSKDEDAKIIQNFMDSFNDIKSHFEDKKIITILESAFQYLTERERGVEDIYSLLPNEKEDSTSSLNMLIYLIASFKADPLSAFSLQLKLLPRLRMIAMEIVSSGSYRFLVTPLFISFWKMKIETDPSAFQEISFLKDRGLKRIEAAKLDEKLRMTLKVIAHHLGIEPGFEGTDWIFD